jgi:serine/threonine-protein kinase RsbW
MSDRPATPSSAVATMPYAHADDLAHVRAFVCSRALARGLPAARVELLALAVSELATNTLQHTHGGGLVRVWAEAGQLVCDVVDQGGPRTVAREMPTAEAIRGRGLAIVARICDEVAVAPTPAGTVVRLRFRL